MAADSRKSILAVFGPTAVGKSRVAVAVAQSLGAEIVSSDSMQVYRGLPILTDQPSPDMLAAVRHHLVGVIPLDEEYSAVRFASDAARAVGEIYSRNHLTLLVGGTGLYIRALLGGFSFAGRSGDGQKRWRELIEAEGVEVAFRELGRIDPASAAIVDGKNPRRVLRALEAADAATAGSGKPVSAERERLWSPDSPYRVFSYGLEAPRETVYGLIDERVGRMLAAGAVEEVRAARKGRVSPTAAQAIGFGEICDYLDGVIGLDDAAAAIRRKSRRYAKRQLTWMRKMPDIVRIDVAGRDVSVTAAAIIEHFHDASS